MEEVPTAIFLFFSGVDRRLWTNAVCYWAENVIIKAMSKRDDVLRIVIWAIIIVLVVGVVTWMIIDHQIQVAKTQPPIQRQAPTTAAATSSDIVQVPGNQMPIGIPTDMPMDANAQILQNFQTNYPNTQQQESVREYVTSKTLAQAYADYTNYFQKNGWTIGSTLDLPTTKLISAKQGFVSISITIGTNSVLNENTVNITASYYAAPFTPGTASLVAPNGFSTSSLNGLHLKPQ
jgi:hypothetical protein